MPVAILRGTENRGPCVGRNILLRASVSDYVHFHDADDLLRHDWCKQIRHAIADTRTDLIVTEASSRRGEQPVSVNVLDISRLEPYGDLVQLALRGSILTSASVCRRQLALAVGGYRESLRQAEDFDFHVRLAAAAASYTVLTEPLVCKRLREDSYSTRDWQTVWTSVVEAVRCLAGELPPRYRCELSETVARAGSVLFKLGARGDARSAFRLASQLGPPRFTHQRAFYRLLARTLGPELTEQLSATYRSALPQSFRGTLASRGL